MEDATITPELLNVEIDLQKALHKALRREEQYWRIKARYLWLKEGDEIPLSSTSMPKPKKITIPFEKSITKTKRSIKVMKSRTQPTLSTKIFSQKIWKLLLVWIATH